MFVFLKLCFLFGLCNCINSNRKKINAINSTKSQLHQPPHDNSCSAHQQPKTKEIFEQYNNNTPLSRFLFFLTILLYLNEILSQPKYIYNIYNVYNIIGWIKTKPLNKLILIGFVTFIHKNKFFKIVNWNVEKHNNNDNNTNSW